MAISYPAGPVAVPANLTQPPATYNRRVWLAMSGLLLFVVLYVLLTGWLGWTAWRLISAAVEGGGGDAILGGLVGICAAFLTVFMVKGLFFVRHGRDDVQVEVTATEQPELFAFLQRLADEAGAPRPHRVFVSPRVNASVSYDLSLLNLVLPSRKNLEIGLGLVNVLTLGELKAVLAHEFGHFTQRSMAVGRWLYVAQQLAAGIVARRDKLDAFLSRLSRFDLRVAWIGWILGLVIWAIRSVVDSVFLLALRAQRALSREMEMHADLVAVSLTGSDAPIYALHRLRTADDAWDRTLAFATGELAQGRVVTDLFAVQSRMIEHMRTVLDDAAYRTAPPLPAARPESFRLFRAELAQPPRMWSTHPANDEREANAKRVYLPAPADDRSGWMLFAGADALRARLSKLLIGERDGVTPMDPEAASRALDVQFARESLNRRYRGIYLDRSVARPAKRPADLYAAPHDAPVPLESLYPESLSGAMEQLRAVEREMTLLRAVAAGVFEAPGGVVRHRGRPLRPRELPAAIAQLEEERSRLQQQLWAHDRCARTAHRAAAARLGGGWEAYLCGLAAVLHYADHAEANLSDAQRLLKNRIAHAVAGGYVGSGDRKRVVKAAGELHRALEPVFARKTEVRLDPTLATRLGVESWESMLEEFKLGVPSEQQIGDWLKVVDGWVSAALGPLGRLRQAALDQLLATEAELARCVADGTDPGAAPPASRVPDDYAVLLPGQERELQQRLHWWKRFQAADGIVPASIRFLAAATIIGAVLGFGQRVGDATVTIYNGLGRPVLVTAGERRTHVPAFAHASIALPPGAYRLRAATDAGEPVDSLDAAVARSFGNYVYNVAGAAALVEWAATYGDAASEPPRRLGAPHWTETRASTLFSEPPKSVETSNGGTTIWVLSALADGAPSHVLDAASGEPGPVIAAHARWDAPGSRYAMEWLQLAKPLPDFPRLLAARLAADSHDVLARRMAQDAATGAAHDSVCAHDRTLAEAAPDDAELQYLATRCLPDEAERNRAFVSLSERWPRNGWLAFAAAYTFAEDARWEEALSRLETARASEPALGAVIVQDLARLRRMVRGPGTSLTDLAGASEELDTWLALETGQGIPGNSPYLAFARLRHGRLSDAFGRAAGNSELRGRVLPLVAASDGADSAWADTALSIRPDSSVGPFAAWALVALATRRGIDTAPYTGLARQLGGPEAEPVLRFVDVLRTRRDPAAAERALGRVTLGARAVAYSVGTTILGAEAPSAWREGAKRLLLVSERPFFQ